MSHPYFRLFSLPPRYPIHLPTLRTRYLALIKQHHPDTTTHGTPELINNAYATLKNPLQRAKYLYNKTLTQTPSPELLESAMEIRENLERGEDVHAENEKKYEDCEKRLEKAFETGEEEKIEKVIVEMQFWESVRNRIKDK